MKYLIAVAAGMTALANAVPAHAQNADAFMTNPAFRGPPPARCISTVQMQHCAAHDLRQADAQMSTRYTALRASLRPAAQQALLTEQRNWLRSRDRDCIAKGNGGGSMASLTVARCWVNVTKARSKALAARFAGASAGPRTLPASAFVGRWRGGEGTYMKIIRNGQSFAIDNQWGLDEDMQGIFAGTLTSDGLRFRRNGVTVTARPSPASAINRSALRGQKDCLMISRDEGYCRY